LMVKPNTRYLSAHDFVHHFSLLAWCFFPEATARELVDTITKSEIRMPTMDTMYKWRLQIDIATMLLERYRNSRLIKRRRHLRMDATSVGGTIGSIELIDQDIVSCELNALLTFIGLHIRRHMSPMMCLSKKGGKVADKLNRTLRSLAEECAQLLSECDEFLTLVSDMGAAYYLGMVRIPRKTLMELVEKELSPQRQTDDDAAAIALGQMQHIARQEATAAAASVVKTEEFSTSDANDYVFQRAIVIPDHDHLFHAVFKNCAKDLPHFSWWKRGAQQASRLTSDKQALTDVVTMVTQCKNLNFDAASSSIAIINAGGATPPNNV
jgi:hypothetical protein